jgi:hypothetical protein
MGSERVEKVAEQERVGEIDQRHVEPPCLLGQPRTSARDGLLVEVRVLAVCGRLVRDREIGGPALTGHRLVVRLEVPEARAQRAASSSP